jgi:hypothetical protein
MKYTRIDYLRERADTEHADYIQSLMDKARVEAEEIIDAIKTQVSTWTENTIELGADPLLSGFLLEYPEWNHEDLYGVIESEIERVKLLCQEDDGTCMD